MSSSPRVNQPSSSSSRTSMQLSIPTRQLLRNCKKKLNNSAVEMQKETTVPVLSVLQSIDASVENITVQLDDFDRAHLEHQRSSDGPRTSITNNNSNTNQPLLECNRNGCKFKTADSATLRQHRQIHRFDDESELMVNGNDDQEDEPTRNIAQPSSSTTTSTSPPNANVPNDDADDDGNEVTITTTGESTGTESTGTESTGTETAGTESSGTESTGTETAGTESDNDLEKSGSKNNSSPKGKRNRPAQRGGGRGGRGGRGGKGRGKGRGRGRDIGGGFPRIQVEDDQNSDIEGLNRDVADFADVSDANIVNVAVAVADYDEDDAAGAPAAADQQAQDDQPARNDNVPMVEQQIDQNGQNQRPKRACTKSPLKRYDHARNIENDENAKGARSLPGRRKSSRKARKSEVRIGISKNDFEKISGAMSNNEQWTQVLQKRSKVKHLSLVVEF